MLHPPALRTRQTHSLWRFLSLLESKEPRIQLESPPFQFGDGLGRYCGLAQKIRSAHRIMLAPRIATGFNLKHWSVGCPDAISKHFGRWFVGCAGPPPPPGGPTCVRTFGVSVFPSAPESLRIPTTRDVEFMRLSAPVYCLVPRPSQSAAALRRWHAHIILNTALFLQCTAQNCAHPMDLFRGSVVSCVIRNLEDAGTRPGEARSRWGTVWLARESSVVSDHLQSWSSLFELENSSLRFDLGFDPLKPLPSDALVWASRNTHPMPIASNFHFVLKLETWLRLTSSTRRAGPRIMEPNSIGTLQVTLLLR
ncbi:hypothetical protein C8R47DRAFT_1155347 [Mycena vitilis]|nr:hypothetical protein C8R47DRAFT_1155347 [Mycena vitilis]